MENREQKLIRVLSGTPGWMTSAELAAHLGCSVRTVKTAVAKINRQAPRTIAASRYGFRLGNGGVPAPAPLPLPPAIPQTAQDRRSYILRKLLLEEKEYDFDRLAGELCISPATLTNELAPIRSQLLDQGLALRTRENTLFIQGEESQKKKIISQLIFHETKGFFNDLKLINDYFPGVELMDVRRQIDDCMLRHHYYLNDYAMSNLILHLAITLERTLNGFGGGPVPPGQPAVPVPLHIREMVDEICRGLEAQFSLRLGENDRYTFGVILMTSGIKQDPKTQEEMIDPSVRELVMGIREKVKDTFDIDLGENDFLVRFGLHLKNMLVRFQGGIRLRNPQRETIKTHYPYIYDMAVFVADEIRTVTGFPITEDEIAYIALHIGGQVEQVHDDRSKIHGVLLHPGYYADAFALMKKIYRTFQDNLLLENIITSYEALGSCPGCELLITTQSPESLPSVDYLQIGNYFSSRDMANLADKIDLLKHRRLRDTLERDLKFLFKPQLFWARPAFRSSNDALSCMGKELHEQGYVDSSFCRKLFEREAISSSALGNMALPHPIDMNAQSTAIGVALCPDGLDWNGVRVNMVFMLAIRKEDRPLFRDIFDVVSEILVDPVLFRSLTCTATFEEFIQRLLSCL